MPALYPSFLLVLVTVVVLPGWSNGSISCDFEDGDCGWKNVEPKTLQWKVKGISFNTYTELEIGIYEGGANDTGTLSSPWLTGSAGQRCQLQFGFSLYAFGSSAQLSVSLRTETSLAVLWTATSAKSSVSELSPTIRVQCTEPRYQLVFEGRKLSARGKGAISIGIDDIRYSQPHQTTAEDSDTPLRNDAEMSCTFKYSDCGWASVRTEALPWKRAASSIPFDNYMELELDDAEVNATGTLSSGWLPGSAGHRCQLQFGFDIRTTGSRVRLSVHLRTRTNVIRLWTTQGSDFRSTDLSPVLDVSCSEPRYQVVFKGRKLSSRGTGGISIGIDDIRYTQPHQTATEGSNAHLRIDADSKTTLDDDVSCDFKYGDCEWESVRNGALEWKRSLTASPFVNIMTLNATNAEANSTGTLSSPWLRGSAGQICQLQFGFSRNSYHNSLQLQLRTETKLTIVWNSPGTASDGFPPVMEFSPKLDVSCSEPRYQILFEGKKVGRAARFLKILNIEYSKRYLTLPKRNATVVSPSVAVLVVSVSSPTLKELDISLVVLVALIGVVTATLMTVKLCDRRKKRSYRPRPTSTTVSSHSYFQDDV